MMVTKDRYVIFGAGDFGRQALAMLGKERVAFFVDNDPAKEGRMIEGIPVCSLAGRKEALGGHDIIIAVAHKHIEEIKAQLAACGLSATDTFIAMQYRETKKKIAERTDYLGIYRRAIRWIKEHTSTEAEGKAMITSTAVPLGYPEVTGYYIPTLLRWGYRDLAVAYAKWLLSIQKEDGSWYDTGNQSPYVFDTGQILKGLIAVREIYPVVDEPIQKGVTWILNNQQADGRLATPDETAWGDKRTCSDLIHLYCLSPIRDAAKIFHREDWAQAVEDILRYYVDNRREAIMNFDLLSHFYAYVMEALLDLGETSMAREAMAKMAAIQTPEGAVPGYNDVQWVCSTGLFQLALVWFRLGEREQGEKAFQYACKLQNDSGGWYGSYPVETDMNNDYFPTAEISWAVKYFLDALYYKNKADFDESAPLFMTHIDPHDGRYQSLRKVVEKACPLGGDNKVLDVGCGKGRYLKNLLADRPDIQFFGVDISRSVIEEKTEGKIHWGEGSLTNIPFPDAYFAVTYACESLEHAVDIESAIREMVRVTKPGGRVVVIDKNVAALGALEITPWEQWFDEEELANIMKGFCCEVQVLHDVNYEDYFQKDLFSVWVGSVKG